MYLCSIGNFQRLTFVSVVAFNVYLCSQIINGGLHLISFVSTAALRVRLTYQWHSVPRIFIINCSIQRGSFVMMMSLVPTVGFIFYLQYDVRIQRTHDPICCDASKGYMPSQFSFSFDTMQYKLLTALLSKNSNHISF